MRNSNWVSFVWESFIATLVVVGLYALATGTQFRLLQIPGYLLIVGFDLLEVGFGSAGEYYYVLLAVYLLGLGVVGAAVVHTTLLGETDRSSWRLGVAGAFTVVGMISLLFALSVLFGMTQLIPVLITGGTGLILITLASWLTRGGGFTASIFNTEI